MANDKVVVLTRELVDELISALEASDNYWNLAGDIREQMERKETPLFNSPTFAERPLTLTFLKNTFGAWIKRREFSFEDFEFLAENYKYSESGEWVKTFWEEGTYGNGGGYDKFPSGSGHYWDPVNKIGIFYLQLHDHEIIFNLDLSIIKVRKDCSISYSTDPEELKWTIWDDETKWLSSSIQDYTRRLEDHF
jgi:hypothetical protein